MRLEWEGMGGEGRTFQGQRIRVVGLALQGRAQPVQSLLAAASPLRNARQPQVAVHVVWELLQHRLLGRGTGLGSAALEP